MAERLDGLIAQQRSFAADASHQLRTPLAVLKAQIQSALRGDIGPRDALVEINDTVERATRLANQMLSLAKVEQLHQQGEHSPHDLAAIVREVARQHDGSVIALQSKKLGGALLRVSFPAQPAA